MPSKKGKENQPTPVEVSKTDHFVGDFSLEDTPSYDVLLSHNMLTKQYRLGSIADLDLIRANSTRLRNTLMKVGLPFICLCNFFHGFEVPNGNIRAGYNGRGEYFFFGPGVHSILDVSGTSSDVQQSSFNALICPLTHTILSHRLSTPSEVKTFLSRRQRLSTEIELS